VRNETGQTPLGGDIEDASTMVTAGVTANTTELWRGAAGLRARVRACAGAAESLHTYIDTTEKNSRASRESGLLCSHSQGESIGGEGGVKTFATSDDKFTPTKDRTPTAEHAPEARGACNNTWGGGVSEQDRGPWGGESCGRCATSEHRVRVRVTLTLAQYI